MKEKYQLIVIGAGPGGYIAAIEAAKMGQRVAVIEKDEVGGTCLNRGCIPTKTLIHTTEMLDELKKADDIGIIVNNYSFDIEKIHAHKEEVILKLRSGIEGLLKTNKITLIKGTANILSAKAIVVGADIYETDNIIIATGSKPTLPSIEGIDNPNVITSNELLANTNQLYKQLVIIGGGVIGVEFATIYNALGCDVTIIEAESRLLPTIDREIGQNLSMILKKRGIKIFTNASVDKIDGTDRVTCYFTSKDKADSIETEKVLVAVGRQANTDDLFNVDFAIETDRGMIVVDHNFETSCKGIYAIGDVIKGGVQLAHVASAQAMNVAAVICGKKPLIDLSVVPACIYTSPEIATIGLSVDEAKELGIPIQTAKYVFSSNAKSIISSADRGFIKIVYHEETNVLLGAQMMCSRATDMIGEFSLAIVKGLKIDELASVIRPHPTYCEGISEAIYQALEK